ASFGASFSSVSLGASFGASFSSVSLGSSFGASVTSALGTIFGTLGVTICPFLDTSLSPTNDQVMGTSLSSGLEILFKTSGVKPKSPKVHVGHSYFTDTMAFPFGPFMFICLPHPLN
ncbi:2681_t:CDS:1, partial [Funneliformis geosporum]